MCNRGPFFLESGPRVKTPSSSERKSRNEKISREVTALAREKKNYSQPVKLLSTISFIVAKDNLDLQRNSKGIATKVK